MPLGTPEIDVINATFLNLRRVLKLAFMANCKCPLYILQNDATVSM